MNAALPCWLLGMARGTAIACALTAAQIPVAIAAEPTAFAKAVAGRVMLQRSDRRAWLQAGTPLWRGDRLVLSSGTSVVIGWRDGCSEHVVATLTVAASSPCLPANGRAGRAAPDHGPLPRALQILQSGMGRSLNEAGTRDQDLPVGP